MSQCSLLYVANRQNKQVTYYVLAKPGGQGLGNGEGQKQEVSEVSNVHALLISLLERSHKAGSSQ